MVDKRWEQVIWNVLFSIVVIITLLGCDRIKIVPAKLPPLSSERFNHLLVATSDYHSGVLVGVDLLQSELQSFESSIYSDAIVRSPENSPYFYVVNRLGADNIQWGQRNKKQVLGQFSVGRGTNPQDIAVVSSKVAYVSRLESKILLKLNPTTGETLKEIDLFESADSKTLESTDPDGFPEMTWMKLLNNQLLILMQRLNSEEGFKPSNKSQLAVLDLATDRVLQIITLKGTNPVTELKILEGELSVGEAGKLGVLDGGVELFDSNLKSLGWVTDEQKLGGDIIDCALLSKTVGVAIIAKNIYGMKPETQLVAFRRSDGKVISILRDPGNYSLHQILMDEDRSFFYLSDRDPKKPGIWVYDIKTLQPVFNTYYEVGLPPYHMVLAN